MTSVLPARGARTTPARNSFAARRMRLDYGASLWHLKAHGRTAEQSLDWQMSLPPIEDVLAQVGRLDDSPGDDTGRTRFRRYLEENVTEPGQLRDYIDQCLDRSEERYARALQDLVTQLGRFLGFGVRHAPYEWLPGQIGFDGRWASNWEVSVVIEIKTRETYEALTPTLARSIQRLINDGEIPNWSRALGLYVIARPDLHLNHLEKAILDERQAHQLRIASLDSLFTLADLLYEETLTHQDVLTVLRSSSPTADWLVELVARLARLQEADTFCDGLNADLNALGAEIDKVVEGLADCILRPFELLFGDDAASGPTDES